MRRRHESKGLTLAELLVGFSVFGLLMALLAVSLNSSRAIWERASSSTSVQTELRKAFAPLSLDLSRSEFQTLRVGSGPISLVGRDSDALWFLSAEDPVSGEVIRTTDAGLLWQRNILYYAVVPNQHDSLYGFNCTGASDADNYEVRCPHKILVRKVIDNGPKTGPSDPPEESLLNPLTYLTRPNGYSPSGASQPGLEDVAFKAKGLVTFRAQLEPNNDWPGEVRITLSSARTEEARRSITIGKDSLEQYLNTFTFSVFPPRARGS